jgi:type IV pilus assembly protein PilY1
MKSMQLFAVRAIVVSIAGLFGVITSALSEPTKIANGPLAAAASSVKPNLMYVIDDSGSMQQDATPDYVQSEKLCRRSADHTNTATNNTFLEFCRLGDPPYMNYDFNFQYYNPAIRYTPPPAYDGVSLGDSIAATAKTDPFNVRTWNQFYQYGNTGTVNLTTQYPDRVWCDDPSRANSDTTNCKINGPGWLYPDNTRRYSRDTGFIGKCGSDYPDDSPPAPDYQCSSSQGTNVAHPKYRYGGPYYYNIKPTSYCTNSDLTTCIAATSATTVSGVTYNEPMKIRYCDSVYLTNCQARKLGAFQYPSFNGIGATGSFTIGGSGTTSITSVKVNGVEVMSGATSSSSNSSTIATRVVTNINNFISSPNYVARSSSNTVYITAAVPGTGNGLVITVTQSGTTRALTISNLAGSVAPATFERVDIVPGTTTYPKAVTRTDCGGSLCSYAEELTNFANWYSYYRTRMNMLKSAVGRSFANIDDKYRVGYITINPGSPVSSSRFLSINDFVLGSGLQKDKWYTRLYGTGFNGSTPLREALSRVGRYFAGATGGINDGMTASPIQLSCQQNFTILSTDGYWNGNGGQDLSGNAIGNTDGVLGSGANQVPRPLYDGGNSSSSGTLADVAQYFYQTDLRTDLVDNVPSGPRDTASHQHMTTFTIGLGLAGQLKYEGNYLTSTAGDFQKLRQGTLDWPIPAADTETALDDLWHAAVNGRGQFFSARNPQEVVDGLAGALAALALRTGAGAAAATSNLQPVAGDNFAFTAEYTTVQWTGDLKARTLDLNTGTVSSAVLWSAQTLLESRTAASRTIFTATTDTSNFPRKLKSFEWSGNGNSYPSDTTLTTAEQAFFDTTLLPQYSGWTMGQRTTATAKTLVDFLRGDKSKYVTGASPTPDTDLYRARVKLFGDIINAQPSYVRASPLGYNDFGFSAFQACTAGTGSGCPSGLTGARVGTAFAAANDGMLHAFDTDGAGAGGERWGFIPSMVLRNLPKLAATNYDANHAFFVDGSPVVGDICIATNCKLATVTAGDWRTILVGGLNSGGRGFYALDITNPTTSGVKLLWEFKVRDPAVTACNAAVVGTSTDCDLGLSYGNPIITKRKSDGKWVVIVTSGYNNINPGSGRGFLYVLDAATGLVLNKIAQPVSAPGTAGTASPTLCSPVTVLPAYPYCDANPSGFAKINVRLENNDTDNTALYVYGGDLYGNLWRYDLTSTTNAYPTAFLMAQFTDTGGTPAPQPITVRPEVAIIPNDIPAVFVGTGKYVGSDDPGNSQQQTIYAVRADLTTTIANRSGLIQQTLGGDVTVAGGTIRTVTSTASVNWNSDKGWYINLPLSGERVNVDPSLQIGTLVMASNVPSTSSCTAGGFGYLNFFDYLTGKFIESSANAAASRKVSGSLIVGTNTVKLPGNKLVTITTTADNQQLTFETPIKSIGLGGKRVSWREVVID